MNTRDIEVLENVNYVWVKSTSDEPILLSETKTYVRTKKENQAKQVFFNVDITAEMAKKNIPVKVPACKFVKRYVDQGQLAYVGNEKAEKIFAEWDKKAKAIQKKLLKGQSEQEAKIKRANEAANKAYNEIMSE